MIQRLLLKSLMKSFLVIIITFTLVNQTIVGVISVPNTVLYSNLKNVSKISNEIEIPAGQDYYIKFDSQNLTLNRQSREPATTELSEHIIAAIAKSPRWIQPRLTNQFQNLSNPDDYADILLNASKKTTDEIAFSIACCPTGRVPIASLLKENAESLYEHDQWIHFADIIEYNIETDNYYSTIRYRILENGTEKQFEIPPDIYYWYVVHPKITTEDIDAEYGSLWRNYLLEHNDLGYPLLKEKLSNIEYLWDCNSYSQPAYRLWSECIAEHPTAIEAISYWIGKTVPYPAIGDRPGQSCIVAHEHNGWCGELQKIAIAAQRAALIPTISASNVGEDHVWREFYERGWHENDNWWSDTGGAVDQPDVYAYGWGKSMSAVYQWNGDGTIQHDTAYYIHPEDRITVRFNIKDLYSQQIDGARIVVLVKGPKDITYFTNLFWENIQRIWDTLPDVLKGPMISLLFGKIKNRINQLPESITGFTITTWGYTDSNGFCSFELGKNLEYVFLIQEGNLKKPWQLARHNTLRFLKTHTNKEFIIRFSDVSNKPMQILSKEMPLGTCQFTLSFSTTAYQLQQHFVNDGIGRHKTFGRIECFYVDSENFQRYQKGEPFTCYQFLNENSGTFSITAPQQDWYFIIRNQNRQTHIILNFTLDVALQTTTDYVQIVTPNTTLFETPISNIDDIVLFSGIATTDSVNLTIDQHPSTKKLTVINGTWSYTWDTSLENPGFHYLTVTTSGGISDEQVIRLIDASPPSLSISTPKESVILKPGILYVSGDCKDNQAIDHVEIILDNHTRYADGTITWSLSWDITTLPFGDHILSVKAVDKQGLISLQTRSFVLNASGQYWIPQINTLSYNPLNPVNTSNVIITANVTATGPYAINKVFLYYTNGIYTRSYEMYRYGQYPIQSRHPEDPLFNQSNNPIFGVELGQFPTGQTITYWILVVDTAHNQKQSDVASFTIM